MMKVFRTLVVLLCTVALARGAEGLQSREVKVDGVARTALVYLPPEAKTKASPLVFIWHGHGGSAQNAARQFHLEKEWPEAICVYPQGLPTAGALTDPKGQRPGWQMRVGNEGDRDLLFFDALLAQVQGEAKVDAKRIFSTGHSNGGAFTYLLWEARGKVFAAVAPSAGAAIFAQKLAPKPALIIGNRDDPLVKFAWQERTAEAVRQVNGGPAKGESWQGVGLIYPSATPLVTLFGDKGGHRFDTMETPRLIVKFFQEH